MLLQRPHLLQQLDRDASRSLALLCGFEGLARSLLVGLMPIIALESLGSKEAVTYAYLVGGWMALMVTLNVGRFERWMPRRWVVTGAFMSLVGATLLFTFVRGPLLAVAIGMVAIAAGTFSVCLSLFIMDYVEKRDFVRNESRRMVTNGLAWTIGPVLAIWLFENSGEKVPFLLAGVLALAALGFFWILRLGPNPVLTTPRTKAPSPLQSIPRFFGQRYLRIAYAITVVRGTFWVSFFVYVPIYVLESGLGSVWVGAMISTAAAMLMLGPLVERAAERFSVRRVITVGFGVIGLGLTVLGFIGDPRPVGLAAWLFAATGACALDILGNIPFMRTVKPRERIPMTTVFSTWREVGSLAAPGLVALVLLVAPFWAYFLLLAALCFATAVLASFLPARI